MSPRGLLQDRYSELRGPSGGVQIERLRMARYENDYPGTVRVK